MAGLPVLQTPPLPHLQTDSLQSGPWMLCRQPSPLMPVLRGCEVQSTLTTVLACIRTLELSSRFQERASHGLCIAHPCSARPISITNSGPHPLCSQFSTCTSFPQLIPPAHEFAQLSQGNASAAPLEPVCSYSLILRADPTVTCSSSSMMLPSETMSCWPGSLPIRTRKLGCSLIQHSQYKFPANMSL